MSDCPKFVPPRDYYDVPRVQNEMERLRQIPSVEMSDEESALLQAYRRSLEIYMLFCPKRSLWLTPAQLLRYQLGVVRRRTPTDVAASEMGMPGPDLRALRNGERLPTPAEADLLASYFESIPEAYLSVPEDAPASARRLDSRRVIDEPQPAAPTTPGCLKFKPIRDYADVTQLIHESDRLDRLKWLCPLSTEQAAVYRDYERSLEEYLSYCPGHYLPAPYASVWLGHPRGSIQPAPAQMLGHQLSCVKKVPTDAAAPEMGMPVEVLRTLVNGERLATSAEADLLAAYFQTVPEDDDD
jgi:plasmid maintenance system antidote protein VapI